MDQKDAQEVLFPFVAISEALLSWSQQSCFAGKHRNAHLRMGISPWSI